MADEEGVRLSTMEFVAVLKAEWLCGPNPRINLLLIEGVERRCFQSAGHLQNFLCNLRRDGQGHDIRVIQSEDGSGDK